jgi:hypothetical protein
MDRIRTIATLLFCVVAVGCGSGGDDHDGGGGVGGAAGGGGGVGGAAGGGGSDASADGGDPAARFEGCVPRCLAELFARCLVPAGSCVSEMMVTASATNTLSCHPGDVTVYYHGFDESVGVYTPAGLCYGVAPMRNAEGRVDTVYYLGTGTTTYGLITLDPPNYRTGTATCGADRTNGQPFNFDDPACSFLKKRVAYDDPAAECASGSCPIPPNI